MGGFNVLLPFPELEVVRIEHVIENVWNTAQVRARNFVGIRPIGFFLLVYWFICTIKQDILQITCIM